MSVYTTIDQEELEEFLLNYSLGEITKFTGIHAGIGNTNYVVNTRKSDFIFTIFEKQTEKELNQIFDFLTHLNKKQFPSPVPITNNNGSFLNRIKAKPAALFSCLAGTSIARPNAMQCREVGMYLAKLHLFGEGFSKQKLNSNDLTHWKSVFNRIKPHLAENEVNILASEFDFQLSNISSSLPKGVIHADLFTDNVLFHNDKISGIVDFYDASNDLFIFDIAVTANDWCEENKRINKKKLSALIEGYQRIRPLTVDEKNHLPIIFRLAALRFWLSRLEHQLSPKSGMITLEKDPQVFYHLLEYYRLNSVEFISECCF